MFGPPPYQQFQPPPNPGFGFYPPSPGPFPTGGVPQAPPANVTGGKGLGFLSQLFGSKTAGAIAPAVGNPATAAAGGMNIGQMLGYAQHAQHVIKTVQTVAPIVQQYGPLLKSLPAFLQLLKTNTDDSEESSSPKEPTDPIEEDDIDSELTTPKATSTVEKKRKKPTPIPQKPIQKKKKKISPLPSGPPKPKLYV